MTRFCRNYTNTLIFKNQGQSVIDLDSQRKIHVIHLLTLILKNKETIEINQKNIKEF